MTPHPLRWPLREQTLWHPFLSTLSIPGLDWGGERGPAFWRHGPSHNEGLNGGLNTPPPVSEPITAKGCLLPSGTLQMCHPRGLLPVYLPWYLILKTWMVPLVRATTKCPSPAMVTTRGLKMLFSVVRNDPSSSPASEKATILFSSRSTT